MPGMFMFPMPPCVSGLAAGDGLACGVGLLMGMFMSIDMSIFCPGDGEAWGDGDEGLAGICIPGMLLMFVFCGDDEGAADCDGVDIPFMFMPFMLMPGMACLFCAGCALLFRPLTVLAFDPALRLAFGLAFGLPIFMPGMSCMS